MQSTLAAPVVQCLHLHRRSNQRLIQWQRDLVYQVSTPPRETLVRQGAKHKHHWPWVLLGRLVALAAQMQHTYQARPPVGYSDTDMCACSRNH